MKDLVYGKRVLLRADLDVPLAQLTVNSSQFTVKEDFRLEAWMPTLELCLKYASSTVIMGHVGRPASPIGVQGGPGEDPSFSVKPIVEWLEKRLEHIKVEEGALHVLENLRFEKGEDGADLEFAKELAAMGDVYINDAFAAYHPAASTTVLPTLLPHALGLNFREEVKELQAIRKSPKRPFVAIVGGAKVEDKLPAVWYLSKLCDTVLVGGKLAAQIKQKELSGQMEILPSNVLLADLTADGLDIAPHMAKEWKKYIYGAKLILWNGPLGKYEEKREESLKVAQLVLASGAESIVGGGDTVAALNSWGLLGHFDFVSTGGGAMLKFLVDGTLPTLEVLA